MIWITSKCRPVEWVWMPVMAWFNMFGTSVWNTRLTKERTIEVMKVSRCEAMMGRIRRHQVRERSRDI